MPNLLFDFHINIISQAPQKKNFSFFWGGGGGGGSGRVGEGLVCMIQLVSVAF